MKLKRAATSQPFLSQGYGHQKYNGTRGKIQNQKKKNLKKKIKNIEKMKIKKS